MDSEVQEEINEMELKRLDRWVPNAAIVDIAQFVETIPVGKLNAQAYRWLQFV